MASPCGEKPETVKRKREKVKSKYAAMEKVKYSEKEREIAVKLLTSSAEGETVQFSKVCVVLYVCRGNSQFCIPDSHQAA